MSLNTRSLSLRLKEIKQFLHDNKLDVLALQETWLTPKSYPFSIRNYSYFGTEPVFKRARGCGLFISKDLKVSDFVCSNSNNNLVEYCGITIRLKDRKSIRVWSIYIHPNASKKDLKVLKSLIGRSTIWCGDFNAHHKEWSVGNSNQRGKKLKLLF
jgi:exonuclease III